MKIKIFNLLMALVILLAFLFYYYGLHISGPFIFGDESTYFDFARVIHNGHSISQFTQYGPLYPLLISIFLGFKSVFLAYKAIKILNILFFVFSAIPAYLLGHELFKNHFLSMLLPTLLLFSPASGFVYLVWAEPIYIFLFYCFCYTFYMFLKKPNFALSFISGVLASSLYYTKPGAGLVVQIAITLAIIVIIKSSTINKKDFIPLTLMPLLSFFLDIPWIMHYRNIGVSIVGYASATNDLHLKIVQNGIFHVAIEVLKSFLYQYSYIFLASWGLLVLIILFVLFRLFLFTKKLTLQEDGFVIFFGCMIFGMMALCAIGMSSYKELDFRMVAGRYYSIFIPLVVVYGIFLIESNRDAINFQAIRFFIYLSLFISIVATPLLTRSPLAFISMPELSFLIYISDAGEFVWRKVVEEPSILLRTLPPMIVSSFLTILVIHLKSSFSRTVPYIMILVLSAASFLAEQRYVILLGKSQSQSNNFYRHLSESDINFSKVVWDKELQTGNAPFWSIFWLDLYPTYVDKEDFKNTEFNFLVTQSIEGSKNKDINHLVDKNGVLYFK